MHTTTTCISLAAFPFLSDLLASHSSEHLSFVLLCFLSFSFYFIQIFFFLFFFSLYLMVWLVLLCSRTRYASASRALFSTLINRDCLVYSIFTVSEHRICISLAWRISTDSGCTDVVGYTERTVWCEDITHLRYLSYSGTRVQGWLVRSAKGKEWKVTASARNIYTSKYTLNDPYRRTYPMHPNQKYWILYGHTLIPPAMILGLGSVRA